MSGLSVDLTDVSWVYDVQDSVYSGAAENDILANLDAVALA